MSSTAPETDTIAAVATAAGGGLGVVRLSGPRALAVARARFCPLPSAPTPRHLYHGWWHDDAGTPLDEGLLAWMPGPASYTGEDVVEISLHGGALNLQRCLEACWTAGVRPADPGEFTRRAFLNGKLDLTRAEAVADLVGARTDRALSQARSHLRGDLYQAAADARDRILQLRARLEVGLDFVDEDVPLIAPAALADEARGVAADLGALAATFARGRLWRDGARVVLVGAPNAGKSSLFNALCGEDRAIVTEVAGTTRDSLEAWVDLLGVPVVLIDTAGLRETDDAVERAGVARTHRQLARADLAVLVLDGEGDEPDEAPAEVAVVRVTSKADRTGGRARPDTLAVSATTGEGLEALVRAVVDALGGSPEAEVGLTIGRERHRVALAQAAAALDEAARGLDAGAELELVAVDVQEATDALGELVGVATIEDVLDHLFAGFCIGK